MINNVSKESKGPQIEVSRTSPELLLRLFEMEVPEIYDGTVVIKSCVREPGERAKIAVTSNERDVDPVGACVGMKGSRVQAIIRELRGEKIDIIEWSDEPSVFAANALSPAKVNQVRITDIENRQMEVIVNEDQLSLAIGKRGQNVRLATKLVGWNIDIRSEEEIKKEVALQMGALIASGESVPLSAIEGVTAQQADALGGHGITDIDALANTSVDDLVEFLDLSLDEAEVILDAAKAVIAVRDRALHPEEEGETIEELTEAEAALPEAAEEVIAEDETEPVVSISLDESAEAGELQPADEITAEGYDEAVEKGEPFSSEHGVLAQEAAEPEALTEGEPISEEEIALQNEGEVAEEEFASAEGSASEVSAAETDTTSAPESVEDAAQGGSSEKEKQDASPDAAK